MRHLFISSAAAVLLFSSCERSSDSKSTSAESIPSPAEKMEGEVAKARDVAAKLAAQHNADMDWNKDLVMKERRSPVFSVDLQRAVLRIQNKPILIIGDLTDVILRNGKPCLVLSYHVPYLYGTSRATIVADVDSTTYDSLLGELTNDDAFGRRPVALVVVLERVQAQLIEEIYPDVERVGAGDDSSGYARLIESDFGGRAIVFGRTLGIAYLGAYIEDASAITDSD
jgi:hypothetical protein